MTLERFLVVAEESFEPRPQALQSLEQRLYDLLIDALELGKTTLAPHALTYLETLERCGLVLLEDGLITILYKEESPISLSGS